VLAAQMGYLPGTIRIIVGAIFAGAVQDMVTLFFSMRRPLIPDDLAVMDPQMFNENPDGRH
jgi:Carbon starvation protein CstA